MCVLLIFKAEIMAMSPPCPVVKNNGGYMLGSKDSRDGEVP
jgi:hypothetical protein